MYELRAGKLVSGKLLLVSLVIVVFSGNTTGVKRGKKSVTPVEGGGVLYAWYSLFAKNTFKEKSAADSAY